MILFLCAPSKTKLKKKKKKKKKKKMLKKVNEWAKFNTMLIQPDTPLFQNKRVPTFYLVGQPIPITKCLYLFRYTI